MRYKTSRNKDIELLHELTKKPYKICRKQLKTYKWNLAETWIYWIMKNESLNEPDRLKDECCGSCYLCDVADCGVKL